MGCVCYRPRAVSPRLAPAAHMCRPAAVRRTKDVPRAAGGNARSISFEIAVSNENRDVVFYAAVPDEHRSVFEKQFLSIFPEGKLREEKKISQKID